MIPDPRKRKNMIVIPFQVLRWTTGNHIKNELIVPTLPYSVRAALARQAMRMEDQETDLLIKMSVLELGIDELTRLAFVHGERDLMALAASVELEPEEHALYIEIAQQLRAYRFKRWGKIKFETTLDNSEGVVSIIDLLRKKTP